MWRGEGGQRLLVVREPASQEEKNGPDLIPECSKPIHDARVLGQGHSSLWGRWPRKMEGICLQDGLCQIAL